MRIAIFDYCVLPSNPAGGCHWRLVKGLRNEHRFTVFSVEFLNPDPERIEWVRIPAPRRPLPLLFVVFHLLAPLYLLWYYLRSRQQFDLIQGIESNFAFADIAYVHFCHSRYLRQHWQISRPSGARRLSRWLDHRLHALGERLVYRRAGRFVVPSTGLKRELEAEYPVTAKRVGVVHNPIDPGHFEQPAGFDRVRFRQSLGVAAEDRVMVFVALGHFERKGLPAVMEAMRQLRSSTLKLLVVGGTDDTVAVYRRMAAGMGLESRMIFAGAQGDVRPFLWSSDAFVLASAYETFSLVTYEAAAAGLPLIVNVTSGIEDILCEGVNGLRIGVTAEHILPELRRFSEMDEGARVRMGERAQLTVRRCSTEGFLEAWRQLYQSIADARDGREQFPREETRWTFS